MKLDYDVIIIGGGPAGLSAALVLGRSRRSVLVCDSGKPRNAVSHGVHGYLTRDGTPPAELLRIARSQLAPYDVTLRDVVVRDVQQVRGGFSVLPARGRRLHCRKVLLATGVRDALPRLEGIEALYGTSVHHCPYCDGWESRDKAMAVYARGKAALGLALSLRTWSNDVIVCSDGPARFQRDHRERLARHGIGIIETPITRLVGSRGKLRAIEFEDGASIERQILFFNTGQRQGCGLAETLMCRFTEKGAVWTDKHECSSIDGLYVAGDASRDAQFVIVAAAEGVKAAVAINTAMQSEERA